MAPGLQHHLLVTLLLIAMIFPAIQAQSSTADDIIAKDRTARHLFFKSNKNVAGMQERGFFGTIFHVILEQINDTKSAYKQISELVNNQFIDENAVTPPPDPSKNTTETPKITRTEFLKILDRNLKGLSRLRDLEWREARKFQILDGNRRYLAKIHDKVMDSAANLRSYKEELFRAKKARSTR